MALYRVAYDVTRPGRPPTGSSQAGGLLMPCSGFGFLRFHPAGERHDILKLEIDEQPEK